ncbi:hypothetical protein ACE5IS_04850 [Leptospira wolffii]|uniref:Uncharacterized protein n=1 Tax=Leptospira wolffii TaxID=409998 RepID=A0A2M9ZCP9_9LEPT|nr:hypothetical protein [Leptospira wolffii]EPG67784.1 hypothetical protein LEP1GSC061_0218 [Leptospira wolffii serovar Khorat str. Khorat-H2]PJZ66203.1 hypothetical protein CH371_07905 [Leptospira wolffii]TGK60243.1 hypothetical protein EHQ32_10130 [Leptospira wolffii]TGK72585.1 hypothetical protein EHQ27_09055 [Leptospira wolffii]TGK76250.1 hypothetical protein EHQ35_02880 [Leptospira wolffii]
MNVSDSILQDIYHACQKQEFVTMRDLEFRTSFGERKLRPYLEDLKEAGMVLEHPEGFQIAPKGDIYYKSNWG